MMKKRIPIYHYICVGVVLGSLFLPWTKHDLYTGGLFSTLSLVKTDVIKAGLYYEGTYVVLLAMIIISAVQLIIRNLGTAIIGLVLAVGQVLYMPLLAFGLTFTLFGSERNIELQIGYYICALSVVVYFGFAIWNLVYVNRKRKSKTEKLIPNEDLLDDF